LTSVPAVVFTSKPEMVPGGSAAEEVGGEQEVIGERIEPMATGCEPVE